MRFHRKHAVGAALGVVALALLAACSGSGAENVDHRGAPSPSAATAAGQSVSSPDGKFTAVLVDGEPQNGVKTVRPVIRSGSKDVFTDTTSWSTGQGGLVMVWESAQPHTLWVVSRDIGSYRFQEKDGSWTKEAPGRAAIPDDVKQRSGQ